MKKIVLVCFLFICFNFSNAQEVYFTHGKNISNYELIQESGDKIPIENGIGNSFEMGYKSKYITTTPFYYTLGLSYNQFNSLGKTTGLNMEWKTNYIGLNYAFYYNFFQNKRSDFALKLGANMHTLVYGKQEVNQVQMDIVNNREFSGLNIGMQSGLVYNYHINSECSLVLGYTHTKLFNISNSTKEKVLLNNQNFSVGLTIRIK